MHLPDDDSHDVDEEQRVDLQHITQHTQAQTWHKYWVGRIPSICYTTPLTAKGRVGVGMDEDWITLILDFGHGNRTRTMSAAKWPNFIKYVNGI